MGKEVKQRCVIVAAGKIENPDLLKNNITANDFIIAADAGYIMCRKANIEPDLFVGDYDSSERPETDSEIICLNPVKDSTDSETALHEAQKRGYKDILLVGATGGRIDHTLANIILTAQAKQNGVRLTIIDSHHKIYAVMNESVKIQKSAAKYYLSVFSVGSDCTISESGVYYPLNKYVLSPFSALGVSNEITDDFAVITVENGTAVIIEADKQ